MEGLKTKGIVDRGVVEEIWKKNKEPEWMLKLRLQALELFNKMKDPEWLPGIDVLDLDKVIIDKKGNISFEELPEHIKAFYEGRPEYEKILSGAAVTVDVETVFSYAKKYLEDKGVILLPMEEAVKKYPELLKRYFGKIFPMAEHRYAALHYALWEGGTFLYVPPNVKIEFPIEAFFLITTEGLGQFEHTLIVVDKNARATFIESCASPTFKNFPFHDGAVEMYVAEGATLNFITVQNWSENVINFNNKRAIVERGGTINWVEGSFGSWRSYVYPSVILREGAKAVIRSFTIAKEGQWKEGGVKVFHVGKNSRSDVVSKSISEGSGVSVFRGLIKVNKGAKGSTSYISCDSLLLDRESRAITIPHIQAEEKDSKISYEARTHMLSEEHIFYAATRGIDEGTVRGLIVAGFLEEITEIMPAEYKIVFKSVIKQSFMGGLG